MSFLKPGPAVVNFQPLRFLMVFIMYLAASPNKRSRSEKEVKLNRREQGWRRMVLRLFMVLANALRQLIVGQMETKNSTKIISHQAAGMIKHLGCEDLRNLRESIDELLDEDSSETAWNAETEGVSTTGSYAVIPPAGPPCPDGKNHCHHRLETVILMCRKEGPNYQRQFRRCPLWRDTTKRCDYFQWLEYWPSGRIRIASR